MFVKGFSVALKFTFSGENQFVYPSTYPFIFIADVCIVVQLNYANKLTDELACAWGESNLLRRLLHRNHRRLPLLLQGIQHHKRIQHRLPLSGFVVTFLGVHILNLAMLDESEAASRAVSNVSLGGKWKPEWAADAALWGVCDRGGRGEETVRLERPEEEGEEYGEDVDETTAFRVNSQTADFHFLPVIPTASGMMRLFHDSRRHVPKYSQVARGPRKRMDTRITAPAHGKPVNWAFDTEYSQTQYISWRQNVTVAIARLFNENTAALVKVFPSRFSFFPTSALPNVDESLTEVKRCRQYVSRLQI
ncbi:hypothetical protein B0H13DRAFT_2287149 [Mycena leptocephala]|nr:hypothetical protein B0H13DRAFT_2287149 [Mycena leptocephala]